MFGRPLPFADDEAAAVGRLGAGARAAAGGGGVEAAATSDRLPTADDDCPLVVLSFSFLLLAFGELVSPLSDGGGGDESADIMSPVDPCASESL